MGNLHAQHRRLTPALIVTAVAILAIVAVLAVTAGPAAAYGSYEHGGITACSTCHTVNTSTPPVNAACAQSGCHTGYTTAHAKGGVASTCWTCHTPGQNMSTVKTNAGCGTAATAGGCHGKAGHAGSTPTTCLNCHTATPALPADFVSSPGQSAHHQTSVTDVTVKPLLTIKTSATSIKLTKTVKVSGLAKSDQAGYAVTVLVLKKNSAGKYVKLTSKPAKWTQTSSSWTLTYKPPKKGAYRFQASTKAMPGTNGNLTAITAGKTGLKNLTVK